MMLSRSYSAVAASASFLFVLLYFFLQVPDGTLNAPGGASSVASPASRGNILDVKNDTLGFSKVFVIALPERSDKKDAMSISASLTGVKFDWIDGVNGDLIPQKAIPPGWETGETPSTLGCWRAHMNAIQKMVKEQIPSALIMEDDADWDVTLKSQLVEFAKGSRYIQAANAKNGQATVGAPMNSPYGDDWDLLWLGHCGARNREEEDQNYYVIHDDPTALPATHWAYPRRQPNFSPPDLQGNWTRAVYEPRRALCMFGYALSLRGAQRLLYHQSIAGPARVSDKALQRVCTDRFMGFKCIAPYPTLIGSHKAAGLTSKDSDREDTTTNYGGFREKAITIGIAYSTRLNMEALLEGTGKAQSQWPDATMLTEIDRTMEMPQGRGVYITKDKYKPFDRPN